MRDSIRATFVILTALTIIGSSSLGAQKFALDPCKLLTKEDVKSVTDPQQRIVDATGDVTSLAGGLGAACTYGEWGAQLIIYSGPQADEALEHYIAAFKKDKVPRRDLQKLGDKAWIMFPPVRDKYEDRVAFVSVKHKQYTFGVSLGAADGKTQESVEPQVITLAKAVMSRLP